MKIKPGAYPEEHDIDKYLYFLGNGDCNIVLLWRRAAYIRDIIGKKIAEDVGFRTHAQQMQISTSYVSWHELGLAIDMQRYNNTSGINDGLYYGTINADYDAWMINPNAVTTLRKYGLSHAVRGERWHIQPIETIGVSDKRAFPDPDDYLRSQYKEVDMITISNTPTKEVYDLQTAYQELGYVLGGWKNMVDPAVLDGRDGKYGTTCSNITKKIQEKYGLPPTGSVDFITYGKIALELAAKRQADAKVLEAEITQMNIDLGNKQNDIALLNGAVKSREDDIAALTSTGAELVATTITQHNRITDLEKQKTDLEREIVTTAEKTAADLKDKDHQIEAVEDKLDEAEQQNAELMEKVEKLDKLLYKKDTQYLNI